MRTTVTIDDALWRDARDYSGIDEPPELIRRALREMIAAEAARRLAAMGGSGPGYRPPARRRVAFDDE